MDNTVKKPLAAKQRLRHTADRCWRQAGLTLLEIMVAVFIFAIAMTTIFGSFNAVIGDVAAIEQKTRATTMGKTCLDRILSDFRSLHVSLPPVYQAPEFDEDPDPYRFAGETVSGGNDVFSRARFTADAHLPLAGDTRMGIAQITYYVQQTDDDRFVLRRSDMLYPFAPVEENQNDPVLCEHVTTFRLRYYDGEGEGYDEWDSDSEEYGFATPDAVEITLGIGDASGETGFHTMIRLPVFRKRIES